jgi:hypothetical protein
MDGIPQVNPKELRRLLFGQSEEKEPTIKWFATQLHLYGVLFKKSGRKSDLKAALMTAVNAGQVSQITLLQGVFRNHCD